MDDIQDSSYSGKFMWSRMQPRNLPIDSFAVQPWDKNTVDLDSPDNSARKKYKTFYKTPNSRLNHKNITQKVFTFRKDETQQRHQMTRKQYKISQSPTPKKCIINPYNINGTLLCESPKNQNNNFPNQFFVRKGKSIKEKQRQYSSKKAIEPIDTGRGASVRELRRRISLKKDYESQRSRQYLDMINEDKECSLKVETTPMRRKGKVISLGYQQLFCHKGLVKHRSANLGMNNPL